MIEVEAVAVAEESVNNSTEDGVSSEMDNKDVDTIDSVKDTEIESNEDLVKYSADSDEKSE